ncbi:MAG: acetate kinase [Oscillospiraceae bacterium]|jgi:acetate kinase|nr:acetate kinase [Oscillospiraceae bacterium]
MKVLAINVGSSSLKYRLLDMQNEIVIAKGACYEIGSPNSAISYDAQVNARVFNREKAPCRIDNCEEALERISNNLLDKNTGVISSLDEICAIGHRIVHGGSIFKDSVLIDAEVIEKIKQLSHLAPLHNEVQVDAIKACRKIFGTEKKEVAVFDTAFHSTMLPSAYMLPISFEYYEKHRIRRYGFHGLSHKFVCEKYADITGKNIKKIKIVSCHLGGGSSVAAVRHFCVVDTSMGFTPLDGLMMATRSGSIDPSVITFIQKEENLSVDQVNHMLNKESGFLGVSGISGDAKVVGRAADEGHERAILAYEMLTHQLVKLIGGYISVMNGCDAIIFTAGIGENHWSLRSKVLENFAYLGVKLDKTLNKAMVERKEGRISLPDSKVDVFVIPTNEELMVARDTRRIVSFERTKNDDENVCSYKRVNGL